MSGFCNFKCRFCPQSEKTKFMKKHMMDFQVVDKVIEDLKYLGEGDYTRRKDNNKK